jgi:hypothetical protein
MRISLPSPQRARAATLVALIVTMSLGGRDILLENQAKEPIAIGEIDGEFHVVVCVDATASEVTMSERPPGQAWSTF